MDLFAPRKFLTAHLQQLVADEVIRGVGQAEDFAEIMARAQQAHHAFVYLTFDKSKDHSAQGKNSIKHAHVYTLILAWQNSRAYRSNQGHGMDEAGVVLDQIEWHVHGTTMTGELASHATGKPFLTTDTPEAFYRPQGWAFYPLSFSIDITRTRTT